MLRIAMLRITRSTPGVLTAAAALLLAAAPAHAQDPKPIKEEKPGLLAKASITGEQARKTALDRVKGGVIQSGEIEEEDGKLVFSFDIKVPGKSGIDEVLVDAKTGAVVSVEHESPAAEAREAAKDAKKKPTAKKPGEGRA